MPNTVGNLLCCLSFSGTYLLLGKFQMTTMDTCVNQIDMHMWLGMMISCLALRLWYPELASVSVKYHAYINFGEHVIHSWASVYWSY